MEELSAVLKKKNQIIYEMNCIEKYIEAGDFDQNLEKTWSNCKNDLNEIEEELKSLSALEH